MYLLFKVNEKVTGRCHKHHTKLFKDPLMTTSYLKMLQQIDVCSPE